MDSDLVSAPLVDVADTAIVAARLERLPASRTLWMLVVLISLGGLFEFYELFSTAYIAPGLVRAGILATATTGFFGLNGIASYIAATFAGMFIGTFVFGFVSDRAGRRAVFTYSLLWYSASAFAMAFQNDAATLNFWRFMTGIGLGVELVTIDAYISELVPAHMRGRAFAANQVITYLAVPVVALLAWRLVPLAPLGHDGWRWIVAIGAIGAVVVWALRLGLPESPRWLAEHGQFDAAARVVTAIERRIMDEGGQDLPPPRPVHVAPERGHFRELFSRRYAPRTVMLLLFHAAQAIGLYGFSNWVPTFLITNGVTLTTSLGYTLGIAAITPLGPALAFLFADRIERKWQLVGAAILVAVAGLSFAEARSGVLIVASGALVTVGATIMSQGFHAYQSELYPTRIRAQAIGFVYSASRISGAFSGFIIAHMLTRGGVSGALLVIAACMGVIVCAVSLLGPLTKGRPLEEIAP